MDFLGDHSFLLQIPDLYRSVFLTVGLVYVCLVRVEEPLTVR